MKALGKGAGPEKHDAQKKISSFFQRTCLPQPSLVTSVGHQSACVSSSVLALHEANGCCRTKHLLLKSPTQQASNIKNDSVERSSPNSSESSECLPEKKEDCNGENLRLQASPDIIHPTPNASRKPTSRTAMLSSGCTSNLGKKISKESKTSPAGCTKKVKTNRLKITNRCRLFLDQEGEVCPAKNNTTPQQTSACSSKCRILGPLKRRAVLSISPNAKRVTKTTSLNEIDFKLSQLVESSDLIPPTQEEARQTLQWGSIGRISNVMSAQEGPDSSNENLGEFCVAVLPKKDEAQVSVLPSSVVAQEGVALFDQQPNAKTGATETTDEILNCKESKTWSCAAATKLVEEDELWDNFDQMSPLKMPTKISSDIEASPFLTNIGRHTVTQIHRSEDGMELTLNLCAAGSKKERICILRGFWTDTQVFEKDTVNVLATFDSNDVAIIDDSQGLLIVNPDHLLTGTGTVSTLFCMRKSVLMEKFKGTDPGNFAMICGILVHEIFQKILSEKAYIESEMKSIIRDILKQPSTLQALYGISCSELELLSEIKKFVPQIRLWIEKYIKGISSHGREKSIKVLDVQDIEENIWSPRYGIKGKIDLTVEVELHKDGKVTKKVVPLELKTGKSSFSAEHRGQVTLYTMMCSDRRQDPEEGLLLYLRDGQMQRIPATHKEKRGLVQLRNELVYYLRQTPAEATVGDKTPVLSLPPPIDSKRFCHQCPYLIPCSVYLNKHKDSPLSPQHAMMSLATESISHLSPADMEYFLRWCNLLELEAACEKRNFLSSIYNESGKEREQKGEGLSYTQLDSNCSVVENTAGGYLTTFAYKQLSAQVKNSVDFATGDMVIVSCESSGEFAVATGPICSVNERSIQVQLDKNLSLRNDWLKAVFRLDRHEYGSTMGLLAGYLLQLITPSNCSERFRRLIIYRQEPTFVNGLKKEIVRVARPILRPLNSPQIRAVFKAVMANDYLLIKGMPGTGKTTTTVALLRLLYALGHSVLLTSYTHSAVDTILLKLLRTKVDFLRLGRSNRIHPKLLPYAAEKIVAKFQTVKELTAFYNSKIIVATTCLGMGHPIFKHRKFDVCVLDEASQALQPACLAPILSANKFILVGDPHQLAPVVQNRKARELGMDESLFKRLDSPVATLNLTLQYRMNREIMRLPNELVYDGVLECGSPEVAQATLLVPNAHLLNFPSCSWLGRVIDTSLEASVLFLDTCQVPAPESTGRSGVQNQVEADLVVQTAQALIKCSVIIGNLNKYLTSLPSSPKCFAGAVWGKAGVSPLNIGIISPYRCQVKLLQGRMHLQPQVEVNTVDQYQGRDKDVILISCVRSTASTELGEILHDKRRLNVAVSRAKHKLVLFGNTITLTSYLPFQQLFSILRPNQCFSLPSDAHVMFVNNLR